jgi:hypothetical protein
MALRISTKRIDRLRVETSDVVIISRWNSSDFESSETKWITALGIPMDAKCADIRKNANE